MDPFARFKSWSVDRQILLVAAGVIVIGGLIFAAYATVLRTKYEVLFTGVRSVDASTIIAELEKRKVPYQLRDGGQTILVPSDQADKSRIDLMSGDLPLKGTVGFELFNKSDMGITEFAQKINYQRALQGELARTIMAMDSVDEARVHLALSEQSIFRDDQKPPKASVTIITRPGKRLADTTIRGIQHLVAAAVPQLDVANVVVLDGHGAIVSDAAPDSATAPWTDQKRAVEEAYEAKIRQALSEAAPSVELEVSVLAGIGNGPVPEMPSLSGRDYPIHVTVLSRSPLAADKEQVIRGAVLEAIHADPNIGDEITIAMSPALSAAPIPAATGAPPAGVNQPPAPTGSAVLDVRTAIFALLFLLLIAGALLFGRARPAYRKLSARQRQAYVQRLKLLLDGVESHGAS